MIRLLSGIFTVIGLKCGLNVEERFNELERIIVRQNEALVKHENLIREQRDKLEELLNENLALKNRVEKLENIIDVLDETNGEDGDKGDTTEIVIDKDKAIKKQDTSNRIDKHNFHPKGSSPVRRQLLNQNVAFYAQTIVAPCIHRHDVIVFDSEQLDVGNSYNSGNGMYVVPVSGIYVFTWSITTKNDGIITNIEVNGRIRGRSVADAKGDDEVQGTGIIVTRVFAGDYVYIRKQTGQICNTNRTTYIYTFAGWMLS